MEDNNGLKKLRAYKETLLEAIISDEQLTKAIANNTTNFLDDAVTEPGQLLYKQIFPYKWTLPEIPDRKEVYITMMFDIGRLEGGIFNDIIFNIYVFVHKDIMRIYNGTQYLLRSDFIMEKLEDLFHNSSEFGVGRLELLGIGEVFATPEMPGFFLTFATVDRAGNRK